MTYEPETSSALGFGFRTGFLGLLHMEIIQERLEREFNLNLITTAPSVRYRDRRCTTARSIEVDNPAKVPDQGKYDSDRGADHHRDRAPAAGVRRADHAAVPGAARRPAGPALRPGRSRPRGLRDAAGRDRVRVLRSAEDDVARLRLPRLRAGRLSRGRPDPARRADQRRARRRAVDHHRTATPRITAASSCARR